MIVTILYYTIHIICIGSIALGVTAVIMEPSAEEFKKMEQKKEKQCIEYVKKDPKKRIEDCMRDASDTP